TGASPVPCPMPCGGGLGGSLLGQGGGSGHLDQPADGASELLCGVGVHRPLNSGARFAAKAFVPSRASSLAKIGCPISISILNAPASGSASVSWTDRLTACTASVPFAAIR